MDPPEDRVKSPLCARIMLRRDMKVLKQRLGQIFQEVSRPSQRLPIELPEILVLVPPSVVSQSV